jgi:Secreted repeat of unknown function
MPPTWERHSAPVERRRSPTTAYPLYRFEGDNGPGDVNGEGLNAFGAAWYVLSPSGTAVTGQGSSSSGGGNVY